MLTCLRQSRISTGERLDQTRPTVGNRTRNWASVHGASSKLQSRVLRRKRIGPFDREARFADLRGVRRGNAGELRSNVVDDIEIAIGTIVVAQSEICTYRLGVRCVHLKETCKGQEPVEGVVSLKACQDNRKMSVRQRQSKSIPCRRGRN